MKGMIQEEVLSLTINDILYKKEVCVQQNVWCVCSEIRDRVLMKLLLAFV